MKHCSEPTGQSERRQQVIEHAMKLFQPEISRRLMIAGAAASTVPARAAIPSRPRTLALIGDRAHNPDYIRVSLDRVFHQLDIAIDYTIDYAGLSSASLEPYKLLLILRDGVIWPDGYSGLDAYTAYAMNLENTNDFPAARSIPWMTETQGQVINDFVSNGGLLLQPAC
jgi:hypothetical protein